MVPLQQLNGSHLMKHLLMICLAFKLAIIAVRFGNKLYDIPRKSSNIGREYFGRN